MKNGWDGCGSKPVSTATGLRPMKPGENQTRLTRPEPKKGDLDSGPFRSPREGERPREPSAPSARRRRASLRAECLGQLDGGERPCEPSAPSARQSLALPGAPGGRASPRAECLGQLDGVSLWPGETLVLNRLSNAIERRPILLRGFLLESRLQKPPEGGLPAGDRWSSGFSRSALVDVVKSRLKPELQQVTVGCRALAGRLWLIS